MFAQMTELTVSSLGISMFSEVISYFTITFELESSPKTIFQTANHYPGILPEGVLPGDPVCVLIGSNLPVILRKVGERYIHVGPCFILGLMDGELMEDLRNGTRELVKLEIE